MMTAGGETLKQWLFDTLDQAQAQFDTTRTINTTPENGDYWLHS